MTALHARRERAGHYLEEDGIATVAIALIRPQAENTRPPRALWVPFELGRPFGPPSDAAFQKRVLLSALGMLVEGGGPTRIIDFPDDDPRAQPDPTWQPPFVSAAVGGGDVEALAADCGPRFCHSRTPTSAGWHATVAARLA